MAYVLMSRVGMRKMLVLLAMMLVTGAAPTQPNYTGKEVWRWTCSPSGHYEMKVQPDGSYQPRRDAEDTEAFEISILEWGDRAYAACMREKPPLPTYLATVQGNLYVAGLFPSNDFSIGLCDQTTIMMSSWKPDEDRPDAFRITNHGLTGPSVMKLERANDGWRFALGSVSLADPGEYGMWMLTGTCKLMVGK